jgi:amino acid adenylation domain-containing protein
VARTLTSSETQAWLVHKLCSELRLDPSTLDCDASAASLGMDSLMAVTLLYAIELELGRSLAPSVLLSPTSIRELAVLIATAPPVAREEREIRKDDRNVGSAPIPLSAGQSAMWYLHRLDSHEAAYNLSRAVHVRGGLDLQALERCFQRIVGRHAALRTTFETVNGLPRQVAHSSLSPRFDHLDGRGWSPLEVRAALEKAARFSFDRSRDSPLHITSVRMDDGDFAVLFTGHHTAFDIWSIAILIDDFARYYPQELFGRCDDERADPRAYTEFAVSQQASLASGAFEGHWEYWNRNLAGADTILQVPRVVPNARNRSEQGGVVRFHVARQVTEAVAEMGHRHGCTLFTVTLAIYSLLLHRYSGQSDLLVGATVAGRMDPRWQDTIGYFANLVPLRARFEDDPTFEDLLLQTRETLLGALDHQEFPFSAIVQRLGPRGDRGRSPLVQFGFYFEDTHLIRDDDLMEVAFGEPGARANLGGLELEALPLERSSVQLDLILRLALTNGRLIAALEFKSQLFDHEAAARFCGHFQTLLQSALASPGVASSRLRLTGDVERQQLVSRWNDTSKPYPRDMGIHDHVRAQAIARGDAIALAHDGQEVPYSRLLADAEILARHLMTFGVSPGDRVGVLLERSPRMVIAALAAMLAGAAYVPLDPEYPRDRVAFMVEDAALAVIVTEHSAARQFDTGKTSLFFLDDERPEVGAAPFPSSGGDAPAYAIYTSGSTGKPKAVVVPHRAATRLFFEETIRILPTDTVGSGSSFSFDLSVWEIWGGLAAGAKVVLVPRPVVADPRRLTRFIRENAISATFMVPAVYNGLVRESPGILSSLRFLMVGGDVLDPHWTREGLRSGGPAQFVSLYGPTETAVLSSTHLITSLDEDATSVSLGHTISNTTTYILDRHLEPVPIGIAGEICIGGDAVALGYWNRPEITADRFVPDPFTDRPGTTLYRTGDLGRRHADGTVEFLGRIDRQVKIRGFRIEPGEIESVIQGCNDVAGVSVGTWEPQKGDQRLAAWVVPKTGVTLDLRALRSAMEAKLPHYMVPAAIVEVEQFPLTPNGKLDRKALPNPDSSAGRGGSARKPPVTATEMELHRLWCEVLASRNIGVDDSFFEIGGDSMKLAQLTALIEKQWSAEIEIGALLLLPTIADQAQALKEGRLLGRSSGPSSVPRPRARPTSPFLVLEERSLLHLIDGGEWEPVEAAAISYIPDSWRREADAAFEPLRTRLFQSSPLVAGVDETSMGRIAQLVLPVTEQELWADVAAVPLHIASALGLATRIGARVISLTGILGSLSNYGLAVKEAAEDASCSVTTGHATTAAAVVASVERALLESDRTFEEERLAILGAGSVGRATLELLLSLGRRPGSLILCDVPSRQDQLEEYRDTLRYRFPYNGEITILRATPAPDPRFYDASFVIAATSSPDVVDVSLLAPGTILVDDSAPNCFNPHEALGRMATDADILVADGGFLRLPSPITAFRHISNDVAGFFGEDVERFYGRSDPHLITGCVLSSILCAQDEEMRLTLGASFSADISLSHFSAVAGAGAAAPPLRCLDRSIEERVIGRFRERFGRA